MRAAALAFAAVAVAGATLLAIGAPHDRPPPAPRPTPSALAPGVTAGGVTLSDAAIVLPDDPGTLPDRPGRALVAQRCTACHSSEMLTTQPRLTATQWTATVTKMREVYRAPVADEEIVAIVAYLSGG